MSTNVRLFLAVLLLYTFTGLQAQADLKKVPGNNFADILRHHTPSPKSTLANEYTFLVTTGTYTDLSGATSVNNNMLWDDPEYVIPIGFPFQIYYQTTDSLYFGMGLGAMVSTEMINYEADYMVFPFEADLMDRGEIAGTSQSPISYKLEGSAGNRIFKLEWKNAGFFEEYDQFNTLNSYIHCQLWLYEADGTIEMRYGTSSISNPSVLFSGETGAMVGLSDYNVTSGFFLSGSPAAPVVNNNFIFLNGNPSSGTIYRFTRNITGIEEPAGTLRSATLLPNPVRDMALLRLSGAAPQQAVLTITDIQGRMVRSIGDVQQNEITISREGMEPGYYLFKLTEGDRLLARGKFIVQ